MTPTIGRHQPEDGQGARIEDPSVSADADSPEYRVNDDWAVRWHRLLRASGEGGVFPRYSHIDSHWVLRGLAAREYHRPLG